MRAQLAYFVQKQVKKASSHQVTAVIIHAHEQEEDDHRYRHCHHPLMKNDNQPQQATNHINEGQLHFWP